MSTVSEEEVPAEWEDDTDRDTISADSIEFYRWRADKENIEDDATAPPRPLPPHLKEISSLASWTVSSYKPGCGTTALRHPSPNQFWQSDGPQPHTLNIHFFKLVAISYMRLYIDASVDESYTPTKMELWAGTGHHDLQMVCEMAPKNPMGWVDVDLSNAGGRNAVKPGEVIDDPEDGEREDEENWTRDMTDEQLESIAARRAARRAARAADREWRRIGTGPTLRCFLVQLRIIENHQNGKDTHLRGLQIFARDETYVFARNRGTDIGARDAPRGSRAVGTDERSVEELVAALASGQPERTTGDGGRNGRRRPKEPDWMSALETRIGEQELR